MRIGRHYLINKIVLLLVFVLACTAGYASTVYTVTLDTSGFVGHPAAPFWLSAQLTDGSGTGNGNNSATLSDFSISPVGSASLVGGASGDLSSGVELNDSGFFNQFSQQFVTGALLSFNLVLTWNPEATLPDQFSLAILDSAGHEVPTLGMGVSGADALLSVDLGVGSTPTFHTYASDPSRSPSAGGSPISFAAVTVTPQAAVPEPSTWLQLSSAFLLVGGYALLRRKQR